MRMRFAVALLSCFLASGVIAQDYPWKGDPVPRHAVKFSPLHLLNFYPTIQLSYETRLANRFTLQTEGGYILEQTVYRPDPEFQDKRGFKARLEPRYYYGLWGKKIFFYGGFETYLNAVNFDRADPREECLDLECTRRYSRNYYYKVRYREHGFGIRSGFIIYYSKLFLDINTGFIFRFIRYHEPDWLVREFPNVEFFSNLDIPNEEDRTATSPTIGLRIGYRFK